MIRFNASLHLPYQVNMIVHYYKSIKQDAFLLCQETKTVDHNVFILIRFQELFPFQICSCEELWVFGYDVSHLRSGNSNLRYLFLAVCWLLVIANAAFAATRTPTTAESVK
jgi:hypothetical protein